MTPLSTNIEFAPSNSVQKSHFSSALLLFLWFSLITLLAYKGFFIPATGQLPVALLMTGILSLSGFTLAYNYLPSFRDYVLALDLRLLVMLHGWRTLGLGFVMLYSMGMLPAIFAFPAGIGDAIAAVWATILGYQLFTNRNGMDKKLVRRWNHFGLIDFMFALSLGILSQSNGVFHFAGSVDSDLMVTFPFVIIPGFLVQVFVITHIIIYLQLRHNWKNQESIKFDP